MEQLEMNKLEFYINPKAQYYKQDIIKINYFIYQIIIH